jgi:hypothetical protein
MPVKSFSIFFTLNRVLEAQGRECGKIFLDDTSPFF